MVAQRTAGGLEFTSMDSNQLEQYNRDGFLILEDFVTAEACDTLRSRAEELVRDFDPAGVVSIFSTREQTRTSDDYFLEYATPG